MNHFPSNSRRPSDEFLKVCDQFKLGALVTESSHPVTANLSEVAASDVPEALRLLFEVDRDVLRKFREFAEAGLAATVHRTILDRLKRGGKIFFTGCGATGRLSIQLVSIWRDFWQQQSLRGGTLASAARFWEDKAVSVMAGGDFALIKSVEGFEDYSAFGRKQLGDLRVSERDVVFAITEGGETSFVIGTAWEGVAAGAQVYFIYNNPDDLLCRDIERSRAVLTDARIEKINLTTGPMAIAGSTRMQATSIQLCVLVCILEMVVRELLNESLMEGETALDPAIVPGEVLHKLEEVLKTLQSRPVCQTLAKFVALEEGTYRSGHKLNYYADFFGIDVLTDTTERSPTYCTPPFRKFDDLTAAESWAFLFIPALDSPSAWRRMLKREPACLSWRRDEVGCLVAPERIGRTTEVLGRITIGELLRFRIGSDGEPHRKLVPGDSATVVAAARELVSEESRTFFASRLSAAKFAGVKTGLICLAESGDKPFHVLDELGTERGGDTVVLQLPLPATGFLLRGIERIAVKMLLNALSTCTMVRLGRVMGNYMIWVVPSNLKLIDRATRYIRNLTGLSYELANRLLFEVIEHVEPRMKSDQAYPPVVGMAVLRAREGISNTEAEERLKPT